MATASPRILTQPRVGYYRLALAPRCWKVPAWIGKSRQRHGAFIGVVDGRPLSREWTEDELEAAAADAISEGELFKHEFLRITLFGETSDEPTYAYLTALRNWAILHRPTHPCVRPLEPMDPNTLPAEDF